MSKFSVSSKTGPVALFALALSGFVPVAGLAQDTVTEPQSPAADVAPEATDASPEPTHIEPGPDVRPIESDAPATDTQIPEPLETAMDSVVVPIVAGRLSVTLAPDVQISALTGDEAETWAMLAHPEFPDLVHTAVMIGHPGTDLDAITAAVMDQFDTLEAVTEGMHQDAPVWVISGTASRHPDGQRAQGDTPRAQIMVTQNCLPDGGPAVFGVVTTQMRSVPVILETILSTLTLTLPDDATACPAEIAAAIMALPLGEIDRPEPPAALGPWAEHERFGVRLSAPEGMRVRRDRDEGGRREYWLTNADEDTGIGSDTVLRVFTAAQRNDISVDPIDSPEFAATLSRLGGTTVAMTDETVQLGATVLSVFRGRVMEEDDGVTAERRLVYFINAVPTATGLNPWVAINHFGVSEAEATAYEQRTIEGLQLADAALYDGLEVYELFDGGVRIAVLPGQVISNSETSETSSFFSLADQAQPDEAQILFASQARADTGDDIVAAVSQRLSVIEAVSEGFVDGVPVWLFDGRVNRLPSQQRMEGGETSPARLVITRHCASGAGPFIIGLLATQAHLDQAGGFDPLMVPVRVTMPAGSAPCPEALDAALAAVPLTADALPHQEPREPPIASNGKPDSSPVITMSAEDVAWATATMADTVQSMTLYLQDYPRGQYAEAARDRLAMLTPPPVIDPEAQAWQEARSARTPEALWTFLKAYPNGAYAAQAQEVLRAVLAPQPEVQPRAPAPIPEPMPAPSKRG